MAAAKTFKLGGVQFSLYEKSIRIDGVATTIFYGRSVTQRDAKVLRDVINLGKHLKAAEIKKAMEHVKEIVDDI